MREQATTSDSHDVAISASTRGGIGRAQSEPPEYMSLEAPSQELVRRSVSPLVPSLVQQRKLPVPNNCPSPMLLRDRLPSRLLSPIEYMHFALQNAKNGSEIAHILSKATFDGGRDSILHYASSQDESWTLDCIVDFMRVKEIEVDILNTKNRTALETAIEADKKSAVKVLLTGGASLVRRNERQQQPLHFAILEGGSAEICRVLMQYGADANSPLLQTGQYALTPLYITVERFLSTQDEKARDNLCAVLEELLGFGAQLHAVEDSSTETWMKFLQAWTEWDPPKGTTYGRQPSRSFRLGHYFRAGQNPLCWFPRQYCSGNECDSLASFIFAHTPNSGLSAMLIESSDMTKYGKDLLYALVAPCEHRHPRGTSPSINELLRRLLVKLDEEEVLYGDHPDLIRRVLVRAPSEEKLDIIETLVQWRVVSVSESREILVRLNDVEISLRMRLAELLLSQLNLAPTELYQDVLSHYFIRTVFRNRGLAVHARASDELKDQVLSRLKLSPGVVEDADYILVEDANYIILCVIQVLTKSLLVEGQTFGYPLTPEQRVFGAAQLRQIYELPELPVASSLIWPLHSHLQQRYRPDRGTSESGPSESSESPDTRMRDFLTPESLEQ